MISRPCLAFFLTFFIFLSGQVASNAKPVVKLGLATQPEHRLPNEEEQLELKRLSELLGAAQDAQDITKGTLAIEGMKAIVSKTFGKNHPTSIFADVRLAGLLFSCNSVSKAEDLTKAAVQKLDANLGTYNEFSAYAYGLLGSINQYNRRYQLAKFYHEKSLGIYIVIVNGDRNFVPYTARAYDALGENLIYTGQWDMGIAYINNAITLSSVDTEAKSPLKSDDILEFQINIVRALRHGGKFAKALSEADKISETTKSTFGAASTKYGNFLTEVALAHAGLGDTANAVKTFEQSRNILWDADSLDYYETEYEYSLFQFKNEYFVDAYIRLRKLELDIQTAHDNQVDRTSSRRMNSLLADVRLLLSRATAEITFSESTPAQTAEAAFSYAESASELAYGELSKERGRWLGESDFDDIQNQINPTLSAGGLNPNYSFYGNLMQRADDLRRIGGTSLEKPVENRLFALAQEMMLTPSTLDSTAASYSRHWGNPVVIQRVHEHQSLLRRLKSAEASLATALQEADVEEIAKALDVIPYLQRQILAAHQFIQQAEWDKKRETFNKDGTYVSPMYVQYTALFNFHGTEYSTAQEYLSVNEALILVAPYNGDLYVFVLTSSGNGTDTGFQWIRLNGGEKSVNDRVSGLLCQLDREKCKSGSSPMSPNAFDLASASSLYKDIIGPFDQQLKGVDHIYAVLSGPLAELPLTVLVTDTSAPADLKAANWLADRFTVVTLPSVASLAYDHAVKPPALSKKSAVFTGFGRPDLSAASFTNANDNKDWYILNSKRELVANPRKLAEMGSVAGARDELIMVASSLGLYGKAAEDVIHTDTSARESSFRTSADVRHANVVEIATHGLLPDRSQNLLEPGLIFTVPRDPGPDDDGLLIASEIFAMRFDADWIILSACNTATSDSSNDSLSTLSRAFLFSGARSLLASRWRVSDSATLALISETLSAYDSGKAGISKAKALQIAMKKIRLSHEGNFGHPRFWAPFLIVATQNN